MDMRDVPNPLSVVFACFMAHALRHIDDTTGDWLECEHCPEPEPESVPEPLPVVKATHPKPTSTRRPRKWRRPGELKPRR
jgi:hypothetical protein